MLFSVIVPVYKAEKYIEKCIESILNQTFKDFELLLIDDASPDSCPQICDEYAQLDLRVKVIHKQNGGASAARNVGLENAKGDYIVYMDSDDFLIDTTSLELIARKTVNNPDIIIYKTATCDESGEKISYPIMNLHYDSKEVSMSEMVSKTVAGEEFQTAAWSKSVRRQFLLEKDIIFKEGIIGEDIDWYLGVIRNAEQYETIDEYLYVYRRRPGSVTQNPGIKNLIDVIWIINKWVGILEGGALDLALRHYLGKTYTGLLIMYAGIRDKEKRKYKIQVKQMDYLLAYDKYPRTRVINRFYKVFGFDLTVFLLRISLIIKSRR